MNRTMIIYILGCILKTEGVLMALPCLVALIYHESQGIAYVIVAVLSLIAGMLLTIRKPKDYIIYLKEGCSDIFKLDTYGNCRFISIYDNWRDSIVY